MCSSGLGEQGLCAEGAMGVAEAGVAEAGAAEAVVAEAVVAEAVVAEACWEAKALLTAEACGAAEAAVAEACVEAKALLAAEAGLGEVGRSSSGSRFDEVESSARVSVRFGRDSCLSGLGLPKLYPRSPNSCLHFSVPSAFATTT